MALPGHFEILIIIAVLLFLAVVVAAVVGVILYVSRSSRGDADQNERRSGKPPA